MTNTLERRLVKLESGRRPHSQFAHLKASELLMLSAAIIAEDPGAGTEIAASLATKEREMAAFEQRPDVREAIEQNIAAGRCPPQEPLDEAFRWPRLLRHFRWHERQYPL